MKTTKRNVATYNSKGELLSYIEYDWIEIPLIEIPLDELTKAFEKMELDLCATPIEVKRDGSSEV